MMISQLSQNIRISLATTTWKPTVHGQSSQTKFSAAKSKDTVNDVDNLINVVNGFDLELE